MKVNDLYEFPCSLNLKSFSKEGLEKEVNTQGTLFIVCDVIVLEHVFPAHPEECYDYELVGILVHSGTADSGHYYSYIKERQEMSSEPKWLEFNDRHVQFFSPEVFLLF